MEKPNFNDDSDAGRVNPFLDDEVEWVGYGRQPWGRNIRAKKKFERGGKFREWENKQGITVSWEQMPGWNLSAEGRYGMLCVIAMVSERWQAWNIEHLRKATEATGTSSVNTEGWENADDWVDVIAQKTFSPDKDFRFADGDWFGLMIVPHPDAKPKTQDVRTDILPVQYRGEEEPPPNGDYEKGYNDGIAAAIDAIEKLRKK